MPGWVREGINPLPQAYSTLESWTSRILFLVIFVFNL